MNPVGHVMLALVSFGPGSTWQACVCESCLASRTNRAATPGGIAALMDAGGKFWAQAGKPPATPAPTLKLVEPPDDAA